MKNLLFILLLGLGFSQTELTTRVYDLDLSWDTNAEQFNLQLQDIVGIDLESAIINFFSFENYNFTGSELEFEVYLQSEGNGIKLAMFQFLVII